MWSISYEFAGYVCYVLTGSTISPDHAILQPASDDVNRHSLRLVGESHGADDLSAVHVANQVTVHGPQAQVTATTHWGEKQKQKQKLLITQ